MCWKVFDLHVEAAHRVGTNTRWCVVAAIAEAIQEENISGNIEAIRGAIWGYF